MPSQSQGVYGSEVVASREDTKRNRLKQLEPTAFKSGGATAVLDPIANYNPSLTNVRGCCDCSCAPRQAVGAHTVYCFASVDVQACGCRAPPVAQCVCDLRSTWTWCLFPCVHNHAQGVEYVEHWKASRGMRDLLNAQEYKSKRVSEAPFHTTVAKDVAFEDVERAKSREVGTASSKRWPEAQ